MMEKQLSRFESHMITQDFEKQSSDIESKITPEDLEQAHKRVRGNIDKLYMTPPLDSIGKLKLLKDMINSKQGEVDALKISWKNGYEKYISVKQKLEQLMTDMSRKQLTIKGYAGDDSIKARALRDSFISDEKQYATMVKQLQLEKNTIEQLYPVLQKTMTDLAEQKKGYANEVIVSRKAQRDKITQWNNKDLDSVYHADNLSNLSQSINTTTQSTADIIGSEIVKRKNYKNLVKLEKTEQHNRSTYAEAVFDIAMYDAINFNKTSYQIIYLLDLKNILKSDLDLAKMSDSDLYKDLANAKTTQKNPVSNQTSTVTDSAEGQKVPVFSYENYTNATLQLDDSVIDAIEGEVDRWQSHNTIISDFQTTLLPTDTELSLKSHFEVFEKNVQLKTYKYLHDSATFQKGSQINGHDIIGLEDDLGKLDQDSTLSVKGRLVMYVGSLTTWFGDLIKEHKRIHSLATSGAKLTATQLSRINTLYQHIRTTRNELRALGVIDNTMYAKDDQVFLKDDGYSDDATKLGFNIKELINKLGVVDSSTIAVPNEKYQGVGLDWKGFTPNESQKFDSLSISSDTISYAGSVDYSKNYIPLVTQLWKEKLDTIDLYFGPLMKSVAQTLEECRSFKLTK